MPEQSLTERLLDKEQVVSLLEQEWAVLGDLLASLPVESWQCPALPGWTVHDVVSHLVGAERMFSGASLPEVAPETTDGSHIKNAIARANEAWVVTLRERSPTEMVADFRAVTAERVKVLRAMSEAEFDAPSWTPVGEATYGRYMEVRVFDFWMHEQDIRHGAAMPGHESGPVAELALEEVVRSLGYIVGKRAAFPDGSSVEIILEGPIRRTVRVLVDGRARLVEQLDRPPTVTLTLGSTLFLRLAGGREDPEASLEQVTLGGDAELARRLATNLAYTI